MRRTTPTGRSTRRAVWLLALFGCSAAPEPTPVGVVGVVDETVPDTHPAVTTDIGGADDTAEPVDEVRPAERELGVAVASLYTSSGEYFGRGRVEWLIDFDGDGLSEVAFGDPGAQILAGGDWGCLDGGLYLLSPARSVDGTFIQDTAAGFIDGWGCIGASVATFDFDGDGLPEMATGEEANTEGGGEWYSDYVAGAIQIVGGSDLAAATLEPNGARLSRRWGVLGADLDDGLATVVSLGDLDGDGDDEIGAGGWNARSVWVLAGGEHDPGTFYVDEAETAVTATADILLGKSTDLDGDGLSELVACCDEDGRQRAWSGAGLLDRPGWGDWDLTLQADCVAGDADGDGWPDVFCANEAPDRWTLASGPLSGVVDPGPWALSLVASEAETFIQLQEIHDVTADGAADLVIATDERSAEYVYVIDGSALPVSGTIETTRASRWVESGCCYGGETEVGDWNGDGWDDLLLRDQFGYRTRIFLAGG